LERRIANARLAPIPAEKLQPCSGKITLLIKGARNLGNLNSSVSPKAFITTDFSSFSASTPVINGNNNPQWNFECQFKVDKENLDGCIIVTFFHNNILLKDQYLGRVSISLYEVVKRGSVEEEVYLNYEFKEKATNSPAARFSYKATFASTQKIVVSKIPDLVLSTNLLSRVPTAKMALTRAATRAPPQRRFSDSESQVTISPQPSISTIPPSQEKTQKN
jgi:hypothetical protein